MTSILRHRISQLSSTDSNINCILSFVEKESLREGDKLPAERELASLLGMSRGTLRQTLAVLESTGRVWRHVGKGTFVGTQQPRSESEYVRKLARITNPVELIEVRLVVEPRLAALAAIRGTEENFMEIERCIPSVKKGRKYPLKQEIGDNFHYAVAMSANNALLFTVFDSIFQVRKLTSWGRLRATVATQEELSKIWAEHAEIFHMIKERDPNEAARLMYTHIERIQSRITLGHEKNYDLLSFDK